MAKILTSREEPTGVELIQELVFLTHEVLGVDEDPADDMAELTEQLENSVVEVCVRLDESDTKIAMLSMDLIQLSLQNATLVGDLRAAMKMLEALGRPANTSDAAFVRALSVIRREGDPEIVSRASTENGIEVDVTLTFTEDKLAEAFKLAVEEYINRMAESVLRP